MADERFWTIYVTLPVDTDIDKVGRMAWYFDHAIRGYHREVCLGKTDPIHRMSEASVRTYKGHRAALANSVSPATDADAELGNILDNWLTQAVSDGDRGVAASIANDAYALGLKHASTPEVDAVRSYAEDDLRAKLRKVISHATGGILSDDADTGLNDICVQITAFRNTLWKRAKADGIEDAAKVARDYRSKGQQRGWHPSALQAASHIHAAIRKLSSPAAEVQS